MAGDEPIDDGGATEPVVVGKRPLWVRVLKWIAIPVLGLLALAAAIVFGLNTGPGKRFLVNQIGAYTTATGLNVQVGRIEGSIYGRMVLRDVRVRDPKGVFMTAPRLAIDWRPFAYLNNHIDVRAFTSPLVTLQRSPEFIVQPTQENAPLLPDIDIDVDRLKIDRFVLAPSFTGAKRVLRVAGDAHIADRRAQLNVDAATLNTADTVGGDRLKVVLDAVPDANRLAADVRLVAPANGAVAGYTGVKKPLTFTLSGRGDWKAWAGKAVATLDGASLIDLDLASREGAIKVRGNAHPGLYMAGPVERLTAPQLDIALDTTLNERKADTQMRLRSDALAVAGQGLIDFGNSRFDNVRVDARLLTPGAIAENLRGRDVMASLALDGPMATPTVNYVVRAAAVGFGDTVVEQVYASGLARVDADRILIPIDARAKRVSGLNAAAGGLLTNVRVNGDLAITGPQILSDNLKIRSDRIDATAIIAANVATGRYTGALKGRVNDYRIESIGIVNLTTDAHLVPGAKGGFGIAGRVVARTSQIFNEGVRGFLGGNATVATELGYSPEGIVTFERLRLNAPQFRITSGSGRYDPAGGILFNANAMSTQYGPITARVTGTVTAPLVLLRAPRPGVGVGLVDLEARVRGTGNAYAVSAAGGTDYGPFSADVLVRPGNALTVDVNKLLFAGVDFHGRVQQTPAGPFAGALDFAGSGLNGRVQLAAAGDVQRADLNARAYAAKIPGAVDFTIGRAIVTGTAILYPAAPSIVADAQVADLRYGVTTIAAARAKINYRGGNGTAQIVANGSNGVPFRIAANARLKPNDYVVALKGMASGIDFATANPAHITATGGAYRLAPTRVDFDKGSLRLAGTYGKGMAVQTRLDRLDLSILNAFVPNLDIGGAATGSLDFSQPDAATFPAMDARLNITNFTRSGIATVSTPVDIVFNGRLLPEGGDARALFKRGPTTIGRMVARLSPLPPGAGSWTERLMGAPLSGGLRYSGPSGMLFSLAALPGQRVTGPIAVGVDFSGRLRAPEVNGIVRADNLTYVNDTYGTRLTNMKLQGRFTSSRLEITTLQARAGEGSVQAQGSVGFAADSGFPIDITARLDKAELAESDALGATATGTLHITNTAANRGLIEGDLTIPEARYKIIRQGAAEVPELQGVRRKGAPPHVADTGQTGVPSRFRLRINVKADNRIFVSGMGLESEWKSNVQVRGTTANPRITGTLEIVRGTYSFASKRFDVDHGIVRFEGGAWTNPQIDIAATTEQEDINATIAITGSAQDPHIAFTSTPALPQDEVLSRLLFGSSPENLSATEAIQLAAALNSLRGSGGGLNPLGTLRSATGIDRLRILGADEASGRGTALAAGKYLTDDIYIEIITDARGFTATQLEIALTKALSVLSQTGSFGGSNVTVRYKKDY
ncbi:translocation/assembly module TamB domain-containing protein [Hephaestia sp. GCM10023244]|uniref:translocation/assembly module TamB domain-containing protein n=1 Tax=unclassified Hephaestia TaxID=2631281 RepID=UPI002076F807|nr:translocation/assembly module TamB domain-containing protein [Hephaestia sp. MAHUQ-44]MCM8730659.1 translocation/assembly module TamB domain-containing protein [Hephaestia sp. MAHUQ-44]